jgi:hypothetical protein
LCRHLYLSSTNGRQTRTHTTHTVKKPDSKEEEEEETFFEAREREREKKKVNTQNPKHYQTKKFKKKNKKNPSHKKALWLCVVWVVESALAHLRSLSPSRGVVWAARPPGAPLVRPRRLRF